MHHDERFTNLHCFTYSMVVLTSQNIDRVLNVCDFCAGDPAVTFQSLEVTALNRQDDKKKAALTQLASKH